MDRPTFTAAEAIEWISLCCTKQQLQEIWSLVANESMFYSTQEIQSMAEAFRIREMDVYFLSRIYLRRPEPFIYVHDHY